jgi:hypothetical protein
MDQAYDDKAGSELAPSRRRWRWPFTWIGLVALGWLICELTARPALGAFSVCIKFGWEDFRTARWLLAADPYRKRGGPIALLVAAFGFAKVAFASLLMSFGFLVVSRLGGPLGQMPGELKGMLRTTSLTLLFAFSISAAMAVVGVFWAWRHKLRIWLNSDIHVARRANLWPPPLACRCPVNRLDRLFIVTAIVGSIWMACLVGSLLVPDDDRPLLALTFLLMPFHIVGFLAFHAVLARIPEECWPDEALADERAPDELPLSREVS